MKRKCQCALKPFVLLNGRRKRRTPLHLGGGVHGCGGWIRSAAFGFCDLIHLSMRVGLYVHPREGSPSSLYAFPDHLGLGSVLHYLLPNISFTNFDG
jgi:hypothetical protein